MLVKRMVPRIAIPSAEPTWREVDWVPDPWPDIGDGNVDQDDAGQLGRGKTDSEAVDEQRGDEPPPRRVGSDDEADARDADDLGEQSDAHDRHR